VQHFTGFVYCDERLLGDEQPEAIEVRVAAHVGLRGR
jgi:hypothetical protein